MDVKNLWAYAVLSLVLSACGSSSGNSSTNNKLSDIDCPATEIKNESLVKWRSGKISRLKFASEKARNAYLKRNAENILHAESNYRLVHHVAHDFQVLALGGDPNWGMASINAAAVWNKNVLGEGVTVAVIDSGIDTRHAQLSAQLYVNPLEIKNGIDDDGNGLIDDIHGYDFPGQTGDLSDSSGHGTHIAGVIAAAHGSGKITGLAPRAKVAAFNFFGKNEDGSVFDAIRSIRASVKAGARVINASWGGPGCSTTLRAEIDALADADVLFVAAAGNEAKNIDQTPSYPAAFNSISQITVGAMTHDEYTAGFSNYGNRVDVVAPGVNILSTYPGNRYTNMSGTSMATPFVAGAAALLFSAYPQAKAVDIKNALLSSAKKGHYPVKTRGSLDVAAALAHLDEQFRR